MPNIEIKNIHNKLHDQIWLKHKTKGTTGALQHFLMNNSKKNV